MIFIRGLLGAALMTLCVAFPCRNVAAQTKPSLAEAKMLFADGRYRDANEIVRKYVERDSSSAEAWRLLGFSLFAGADYVQATEALEASLKRDSSSVHAWRSLGQCYRFLGNIESARMAFEAALVRDSSNAATLSAYATFCDENRFFPVSIRLYERLREQEPKNPLWYVRTARAYAESMLPGAEDRASVHYLTALDLLPKNLQYRLELLAFLANTDNNRSVIDVAGRGLTFYPDELLLWRKKAAAHNKLEQHREAQTAYLQCLRLGDSSLAILRELGVVYFQLKRPDSAAFFLRLAFGKMQEIDTRLTSFLAFAEREVKNYDDAVILFNVTLQGMKRKQFAGMLVQLGMTYNAMKNTDRALEYYRQALSIDSANAETRYALAILYDQLYRERTATAKTAENKSGDAKLRQQAVLYFKEFLMRSGNTTLATVRYAVQKLKEYGETLPPMPSPASVSAPVLSTSETLSVTSDTVTPATGGTSSGSAGDSAKIRLPSTAEDSSAAKRRDSTNRNMPK